MDIRPDPITDPSVNLLSASAAQLISADFIPQDGDSIERITTLGVRLTNPYLIPNMQQAYTNLGLSSSLATINNKYVRFKPTSVDQLATLDSTLETQNLEMFDTPVDYVVTYEGDYYQDPSIPEEQITWQYAVVPVNFVFPTGIQYEIIAQIHIPGDSYTAVETEAERLASLQDGLNGNTLIVSGSPAKITPNVAEECAPCYVWDPIARKCVPQGGCGTNPPPPAPDAAVPGGNITVFDNNFGTNRPVQKARVVARRWFKIERVFTSVNGNYTFTKKFKDKVRINVKFKNSEAQIRAFRGARLWQMLYAVQRTLGIISGNKSAINHTFLRLLPVSSKGMRYWAAATVHNAVQEYRVYAPQEGIALPPTGLEIILTSWGRVSAAAPLYNKRWLNGLGQEFVLTFLATAANPIAGGVAAAIAVLKHQFDITVSYNIDVARLNSDWLKETAYHELTHTGHYTALGNAWYTSFVDKVISEVISNVGNPTFSPYGGGNNSYASPMIALGESWAYYMGHFLANRTYGLNSGISLEQGIGYTNNNPVNGLSSHINLLEDFSPFRTNDPFHWIPQGLFYDLNDNRNDNLFNTQAVTDQVTGYTNAQMFSAFQSTIYTLQAYRVRLLQINNNNNNSTPVINLFSQYGY